MAGDTLHVVEKNTRLKALFLELAESMEVVLACRVSPKQKADVVEMVQ